MEKTNTKQSTSNFSLIPRFVGTIQGYCNYRSEYLEKQLQNIENNYDDLTDEMKIVLLTNHLNASIKVFKSLSEEAETFFKQWQINDEEEIRKKYNAIFESVK